MKKNLFTILHILDKNIWGEQINSNKYLATISLLHCTLNGILWGGSNYLAGMFDWNIDITLTISLASVVTLIGYNIAESIIATDSAKIAALRALMMTGLMILGFIAGALGSVILLAILTIFIAIYLCLLLIRMALSGGTGGSGGGSKTIILDNGTELTHESSDLIGGGKSYQGNDGKTYRTDDGGHTYRQE